MMGEAIDDDYESNWSEVVSLCRRVLFHGSFTAMVILLSVCGVFYISPILSLSKPCTLFSASSGNTLTSTNSSAAYAKCLFIYASPQTSNSPSTSVRHAPASFVAKNCPQTAGGISERIDSAAWRLIAALSSSSIGRGGEGGGGGSVELGNIIRRIDCRIWGKSEGGWRCVVMRWWRYLFLEKIESGKPDGLSDRELSVH